MPPHSLTLNDLKYLRHLITYSIESVEKVIPTQVIDEHTAVENELQTLQFRLDEIRKQKTRREQPDSIKESKVASGQREMQHQPVVYPKPE